MPALLDYLESGVRHDEGRPRVLMPEAVAEATPGSRKYLNDRSIFGSLDEVPLPRWDLVRVRDYQTLMIQTTAGCLFRASRLDRRIRRQCVAQARALSGLVHGAGGDVQLTTAEVCGLLDPLVEFARDYRIRFVPGKPLDQVREWHEAVRERLSAGLPSTEDIRTVCDDAAGYLKVRIRSHRFPGIELVRAVESALSGLHYQTVTDSITEGGALPLSLTQRPGAPMHQPGHIGART